jgi:hypothetical protein
VVNRSDVPALTVAEPRRTCTGLPCYAPRGHPRRPRLYHSRRAGVKRPISRVCRPGIWFRSSVATKARNHGSTGSPQAPALSLSKGVFVTDRCGHARVVNLSTTRSRTSGRLAPCSGPCPGDVPDRWSNGAQPASRVEGLSRASCRWLAAGARRSTSPAPHARRSGRSTRTVCVRSA